MRTVAVKNISGSEIIIESLSTRLDADEVKILQQDDIPLWADSPEALSLIMGNSLQIGDGTQLFSDYNDQVNHLKGTVPQRVKSVSEPVLTWEQLKGVHDSLSPYSLLYYANVAGGYFIWCVVGDQKLYVPLLETGTAHCTEFENSYKPKANKKVAPRSRITTCDIGRALHDRFISFVTSAESSEFQFDNTDHEDKDWGDLVYRMVTKDTSGENPVWTETSDKSLCDETWIDWEPKKNFEIMGGAMDIPDTLPGDTTDELRKWEVHVVAAPDIPRSYGGTVTLISNPRLLHKRGKSIGIDASLNPKEIPYDPITHAGKIRIIVKHPRGAQIELQINFRIFW